MVSRTQTFVHWAELSGLVPMIGINNGYCFAGNAAILGCCDIIISTEDSNIGMGGPAMVRVMLSRFACCPCRNVSVLQPHYFRLRAAASAFIPPRRLAR